MHNIVIGLNGHGRRGPKLPSFYNLSPTNRHIVDEVQIYLGVKMSRVMLGGVFYASMYAQTCRYQMLTQMGGRSLRK